jgi:hypothetical protein
VGSNPTGPVVYKQPILWKFQISFIIIIRLSLFFRNLVIRICILKI